MKKIISNIKPFLIFQSIMICISVILALIDTHSDLWIILAYGVILPCYSGGLYFIGAIFGIWTQIRSKNHFGVLLCKTFFA